MFSISERMHLLKQHSARDTSSLAKTRDLIFMCCTLPARISANHHHTLPILVNATYRPTNKYDFQ